MKKTHVFIYLTICIILLCIIFKKSTIKETFSDQKICLICLFKNENYNTNIDLFLQHYLWQGVDKFYLVDNDSNDDPLSVLQKYIDDGKVEYMFRPKKHAQIEHLHYVFDNYNIKHNFDWVIYCDFDEFFYGYPEILKKQLLDYDCDVIYSRWRLFGSDGLIEHPEDIRTAITHRKKDLDTWTKYIFNPKNIDTADLTIHNIKNEHNKYKELNEDDKIRLNHYQIQSLDYFKSVKMTRGDSNVPDRESSRNLNYFNEKDHREIEDTDLKDLVLSIPSNIYNENP